MLRINQLKLPVGHSEEELLLKVKKLLRTERPFSVQVVRRSVDARKKPELYFNYILDIQTEYQKEIYKRCDQKQITIWEERPYRFPVSNYKGKVRPVIIGAGPAGLFCAYFLAEAGFRPILLERGASLEERKADVERFWKTGALHPDSNVQFGEGGAGTFSDGKLNTLVKDKFGRNKTVLSVLVKEGAPKEILYDHKPHLGTDVLSDVIRNMREHIAALGGEVRFHSPVTDFVTEKGRIKELIIGGRERLLAEYVVLAPGHSARDTFQTLYELGVQMEAKPFAVGLRVEHPQKLINLSQYGVQEHALLGSAPYKLTFQSESGRGVYSFCMCPGGYVVNASSEKGRLAVNGMSYSERDSRNANSAIIISVRPEDYGGDHPLSGIAFQRRLEERAYQAGRGQVPVETYGCFKRAVLGENVTEKEVSSDKVKGESPIREGEEQKELWEGFGPCIKGLWQEGPVHEILPFGLNLAFLKGMEQFGRMLPGFSDDRVLLEGIESRTSSPLRIRRDETLQSSVRGIFPCGEGAGYAGGITSAAMDGMKVAEEVARQIAEGMPAGKAEIRRKYVSCRNAMTKEERLSKSHSIWKQLKKAPCFLEADMVMVYLDYKSEVITTGFLEELFLEGKKRIFAPRVEGNELAFYEIFSMKDLKSGYRGIREPSAWAERLFTREMMEQHRCLLMVPGCVFDRRLGRLGYGKGFYDRFLSRFPGLTRAGIAFGCQIAEEVPMEGHDTRMDLIVTEEGIISL